MKKNFTLDEKKKIFGIEGKEIQIEENGTKKWRHNKIMNFTFKDSVWLVGVFVALGATWGMTSQRVTAMETDLDRMETAIQIFTKIETRIAVIENEVININKKLERMSK
jgi:hypothetical protein